MLSSSATAIGAALRRRELTAAEVVDAHIARIERVNPSLNAVVRDRFTAARAEARAADERAASLRPDELPPLHGVPFTTKDALAAEGMPHTSGLWSRRSVVADRDATAVARLKAAGAILVGVTNISELCMWMESNNKVWGRTNNAYDPARTAGGSSGGEGAIVGAGGVPIGLGSDVGGSIRMPAFFNGVFGHKPTGGLVPSTGHHPVAENLVQRYVTTGPLARRAEDLMPFLRVVAGPDGVEANALPARELGDPSSVDVARLRVWVVPDNGLFAVEPAMQRAQARAARALEAAGARVERRALPSLKRSIEIWSAMLDAGGGPSFYESMAAGGDLVVARELAKLPLGRSRFTFPGLMLCLIERVPKLLGERRGAELVTLGRELRAELDALLGDDGVLLFPSYPTVAPRHIVPLLVPLKWVYTAIFNVLELPVTQVPLGLDERDLPVGVQVAAAHGADHRTIAVALALEQAIGGWTPPPRLPL
ncbi:MAG: amidase [Labilithrix sp.]|nr:amidase [Labilithrix sp.]MCW5812784.1 amidase [Labilithrix sp.]